LVEAQLLRTVAHNEESASQSMDSARVRFVTLRDRWVRETLCVSSLTEIAEHPALLEIVDLGPRVIAWILDDLRRNEHLWFSALASLTGVNPITPDARGDFEEMRRQWLRWGEQNGFGRGA